jgi:hypothetical protein
MVLRAIPEPSPPAAASRCPPRSFRWLVSKGIITTLEALDRRADRWAQPRCPKIADTDGR